MADIDFDLPEFHESDSLGRCVFSSNQARRASKGTIVHRIFLEREGVDSLSVDRLDHAPAEDMAQIGDRLAEHRNQQFYGWAVVVVADAARDNRSVRAAPLFDDPYHAEIDLNLGDEQDLNDQQMEHANALSAAAGWRARP